MTKKTREASSKGLGRRKVKKGKEGQKEEKAAIVTTGSWEKNHTKSSVRCLRWLRWPSKMSFLLRCLRYWGPFWIIETFLLRLIRLIRSFDILVWHFRSFYRILSIFAHFGKPHRPFCQSHAIKTNFKLKGKKIETIQQQKSHKLPISTMLWSTIHCARVIRRRSQDYWRSHVINNSMEYGRRSRFVSFCRPLSRSLSWRPVKSLMFKMLCLKHKELKHTKHIILGNLKTSRKPRYFSLANLLTFHFEILRRHAKELTTALIYYMFQLAHYWAIPFQTHFAPKSTRLLKK